MSITYTKMYTYVTHHSKPLETSLDSLILMADHIEYTYIYMVRRRTVTNLDHPSVKSTAHLSHTEVSVCV